MPRVPVIEENPETGWSDWQTDMGRNFKLICCDCGLSHEFEFKTVDNKLIFRVREDRRSTAAVRRKRGRKPKTR